MVLGEQRGSRATRQVLSCVPCRGSEAPPGSRCQGPEECPASPARGDSRLVSGSLRCPANPGRDQPPTSPCLSPGQSWHPGTTWGEGRAGNDGKSHKGASTGSRCSGHQDGMGTWGARSIPLLPVRGFPPLRALLGPGESSSSSLTAPSLL